MLKSELERLVDLRTKQYLEIQEENKKLHKSLYDMSNAFGKANEQQEMYEKFFLQMFNIMMSNPQIVQKMMETIEENFHLTHLTEHICDEAMEQVAEREYSMNHRG